MKLLTIIFATLFLSGCAIFGPDIPPNATVQTQEFTLVPPKQTRPITMKEVKFNVISKQVFIETLMEKYEMDLTTAEDIAGEVFEEDISLFTVNAQYYGNLGENMQEIIRFIKQQQNALQYYRDNVPEPKKGTDTESENE
jgi:hypothetical protein